MLYEDRYDLDKMSNEVDAEAFYASLAMETGHIVICPLANTVKIEDMDVFTGEEFVVMDLRLLKALKESQPQVVIVMRRGWLNASQGASEELKEAELLGYIVIFLDDMTDEEFVAETERLKGLYGPIVFYFSGKYRHWLPKVTDSEVLDSE